MMPEIQAAMEHFSKIRTLPLTNYAGFTIIDSEDYNKLKEIKFCRSTHKSNYAIRTSSGSIPITHIILYVPKNLIVDHKNSCPLDNRKKNFRLATKSQNNCNRIDQGKENKFGYKGLLIDRKGYFRAAINKKRIKYNSKRCNTIEEAALEYNKLAIKYHGEFAVLNVIK